MSRTSWEWSFHPLNTWRSCPWGLWIPNCSQSEGPQSGIWDPTLVVGHLVSPRADVMAFSLGHSYGHQRSLDGRGCFSSTWEWFRSMEALNSIPLPHRCYPRTDSYLCGQWGEVTESSISESWLQNTDNNNSHHLINYICRALRMSHCWRLGGSVILDPHNCIRQALLALEVRDLSKTWVV